MLDIIIPVYNEESWLLKQLDYFYALKEKAHLIFVDGGSTDQTIKIAEKVGQVIFSAKGRACQMNAGVLHACSDALLFLHVDTIITIESSQKIEKIIMNKQGAGCFTLKVDDVHFIFRIFEFFVNIRAKLLGTTDGDCGLFIHKSLFIELGGFDDVDVMEDILFGRKLKSKIKLQVLKDKIQVSARNWRENGFIKIFFLYCKSYLKLWFQQII